MYTCTSFLNRNWIILYILLNNLLFKMCIYILEYVIHTQVQSSRSTKSSSIRSKSPSHPVCQPLVLQLLVSPCRDRCAFSNVCIIVSQLLAFWTHFLPLVVLHSQYHEHNTFCASPELFQQHPHWVSGPSFGNQSCNSDYFTGSQSLL